MKPMLLLVYYLLVMSSALKAQSVDLSLAGEQSIKLTGNWGFFWDYLLEPGEQKAPDLMIDLKQPWNRIVHAGGQVFPSQGRASYQLTLKNLPASPEPYSVFMRGYYSACRLIVYDPGSQTIVAQYLAGDLNPNTHRPEHKPILLSFSQDQPRDLVLIVQLANYLTPWGGVFERIKIGPAALVHREFQGEGFLFFMAGGILICAILYNIFQWLVDRQERYSLWLAIASLFSLIRLLTISDNFRLIVPEGYWLVNKKLEFITIVGVASFSMYSVYAFPWSGWIERITRWNMWGCFASMAYIAYQDYLGFAKMLPFFQAQLILSMLMSLCYTIYSIKKGYHGAWLGMVGAMVIILFVLHDIFIVNWLTWHPVYLGSLASSAYALIQSLSIALRSHYLKTEALRLAQENFKHQEHIRLETEARFQLSSDAAHHVNNPLAQINFSILEITENIEELRYMTQQLIGSEVTDDPYLRTWQEAYERVFHAFESPTQHIQQASRRITRTIREIRHLSGVDGYNIEALALASIAAGLNERLNESGILMKDSDSQIKLDPASEGLKVFGNSYVLVHALSMFIAQTQARRTAAWELHMKGTADGFELKIRASGLIESEKLSFYEKKINHILAPFNASVLLFQRDDAITLSYTARLV